MNEFVKSFKATAEQNAPSNESDYVAGGILHCGLCHTPKQCRVEVFGLVSCMCQCESNAYNAVEAERKAINRLEEISRLRSEGVQDKQILNHTFERDDGSNAGVMRQAWNYCENWAQMYADNIGLRFWGPVGTGKSYAAACIANRLIDKCVPVLVTDLPKIINALSGFATRDKNGYIDDLCQYGLLVIDDFGVERQTETACEIVFSVINARYKSGRPLIITTNLSEQELANPLEPRCVRVYDRIREMTTAVFVGGASRRQTAAAAKMEKAKALLAG